MFLGVEVKYTAVMRSIIENKYTNILVTVVIPLSIIAVLVFILNSSSKYCEFSVTNKSGEDLAKVVLTVSDHSSTMLGLKEGQREHVRFKIGQESSLAISAITKSGKLVEGQNLVYISDPFNTLADIDIGPKNITVKKLKSNL